MDVDVERGEGARQGGAEATASGGKGSALGDSAPHAVQEAACPPPMPPQSSPRPTEQSDLQSPTRKQLVAESPSAETRRAAEDGAGSGGEEKGVPLPSQNDEEKDGDENIERGEWQEENTLDSIADSGNDGDSGNDKGACASTC